MIFKRTGMGAIVPAVVPIYPDPVVAAAARQGMGCPGDGGLFGAGLENVGWREGMSDRYQPQGRDILWRDVGLSGLGDFAPASFPVPQNPITNPAVNNALMRGFAGMRGIGAFDTSSFNSFVSSVEHGSTSVFGNSVANWMLLAGAAVAVVVLTGKGRR